MADSAPSKRRICLVRPMKPTGIGVFRIIDGKATNYYTFHEIPCDIGGRGFAVHRLGLGQLYHVRIGSDAECSCECMGFLSAGHCKHIEGLLTLARNGLL